MSKKVSITDIAKHAGVSIASVSYVLNGLEKEKRVGPEIAEKIRETAALLNYHPNHIAKSLKNGSTKTIGLIVADISNSFFGDLAKAIEEEAFKNGYTVIVGSSDENPDKSQLLVDTLQSRQVDGIIITPAERTEKSLIQLADKLPVVLVDRYLEGGLLNSVHLDNYNASYEAVKLLAGKGYKKIAAIGYKSDMNHIRERFVGYERAMEEFNPGQTIHKGEVNYQSIERDIDQILYEMLSREKGIEAAIFLTNSLTVAGLYYFQSKDIRIPRDLAVIGFDGNVAFDFFYAPLTYIKQPVRAMGVEAVKRLIENIKGKKERCQVQLQHELVERKSSE